MYIKRTGENDLKAALDSGKVVLVLGARQVGKTTLVQEDLINENIKFLNFDIEIDKVRFLAAASLSPAEGLRTLGNPAMLVLDEAQRLPETDRIVKGWHDSKIATRILLLGSSCELFFWRSRSQAEVDLVVKSEHDLKAFEIKWKPRRIKSLAFHSAYGVEVSLISPVNPFFEPYPG